jgi:hypothetical protein
VGRAAGVILGGGPAAGGRRAGTGILIAEDVGGKCKLL